MVAVAAAAALELLLMIVTIKKEAAMAVNVRKGVAGMILAVVVVEVMPAVTEAMGDQTAVTHHLNVVTVLLQTVPGQGAMVVGPQQKGLTHQGPTPLVSLKPDDNCCDFQQRDQHQISP